jgi:hypothetical protein
MCVCVRRFLWSQGYGGCVVAWGKEGGLWNCFIHQLTLLSVGLYLSLVPFISVALRWKLQDRDVSTVQAAVSREETAQPCCKTKTNQTNGSTLHSTERWLYDCVHTSLNVSTLFSSPGLMASTGCGNVDTTLGLISANKQTVSQDYFSDAMSDLQVVADSALCWVSGRMSLTPIL